MNTHDKIELPPLHEFGLIMAEDTADMIRAWGIAAIEADRKRGGEPVAWRWRWKDLPGSGWQLSSVGGWRETDAIRAEPLYLAPIAPQPALDAADLAFIADELRQAGKNRAADMVLTAMAYPTQPAEPATRKRRYAQGTALGEFGIIPMCDQVDDEPVKVPSDAELEKAWDSFEAEMARHPTDDELEEFMAQFADEMGHIHSDQHAEAARAILARYGKGTP